MGFLLHGAAVSAIMDHVARQGSGFMFDGLVALAADLRISRGSATRIRPAFAGVSECLGDCRNRAELGLIAAIVVRISPFILVQPTVKEEQ